jgi:hypothetical protein
MTTENLNFLPLEGWRKFKEFLTGWLAFIES